jgi:hypothetical protein
MIVTRVSLAFAALVAFAGSAHAEASEIRLAKQFSMGYVQFNVIEDRQLIEKHARAAGLGKVKVNWTLTPENTMKFAEFMASTGALKEAPKFWNELFFAEVHDRKGS